MAPPAGKRRLHADGFTARLRKDYHDIRARFRSHRLVVRCHVERKVDAVVVYDQMERAHDLVQICGKRHGRECGHRKRVHEGEQDGEAGGERDEGGIGGAGRGGDG